MRDPVRRTILSHALAAVGMSLPWPLLLLLVWEQSGEGWELGLAGAARMLPYVALSWLAGRLADRFARDRVVRLTLVARVLALVAAAVSLSAGSVWPALGFATLAVAVATPAYPALAAGLPGLAGPRNERATSLLVTCEVASFVVGPALGGILLAASSRAVVPWTAVACSVAAWWVFSGVPMPGPGGVPGTRRSIGVLAALRRSRVLRGAVASVAVVNAVAAGVGLALLPLSEAWSGADSGTAFGLATGTLGFGALGGPVLGRLGSRWDLGPRTWLVVLAGALAAVPAVATLWAALPLLALAGAAAVQVEIVATEYVQAGAPDELRASVLGLTDTAMVAAALVAALVTPTLADQVGGTGVMVLAVVWSVAAVLLVRSPAAREVEAEVREPVSV